MIPKLKDVLYAERLDKLKLWTLEERRLHADLIEVYKVVHSLSAIWFEELFEFDNNGCTRGHTLKLKRQRRCQLHLRLCFSERPVKLWNSVDD